MDSFAYHYFYALNQNDMITLKNEQIYDDYVVVVSYSTKGDVLFADVLLRN